jgi:hypothetical protein
MANHKLRVFRASHNDFISKDLFYVNGSSLPQSLQQPADVLFRTPALYQTTACFYHSFEEVKKKLKVKIYSTFPASWFKNSVYPARRAAPRRGVQACHLKRWQQWRSRTGASRGCPPRKGAPRDRVRGRGKAFPLPFRNIDIFLNSGYMFFRIII